MRVMMTTALKIISRAFQKAGIKAAEVPLTPSEIEDGLDVLNDMVKTWGAVGILKGVTPVIDVGDDLNEPDESSWALKANLAIMMAGEYRVEVSQSMAIDATNSLEGLISSSTDLESVPLPSTLPMGSGNDEQYYNSNQEFFPENEKENF